MKKIFLLLIASGGFVSSFAQSSNNSSNVGGNIYGLKYTVDSLKSNRDTIQTRIDSIQASLSHIKDSIKRKSWLRDGQMSHTVLDINGMGGMLTQDLTRANTAGNYLNGINTNNTGKLKFDNGMSYGGDIQLGYFLGKKAHWGVGIGFQYLYQTGDLTLDQYRVQYQSTDGGNNIFRQVTTANGPIKEKLEITNMNIPLMLKYKNRFTKHSGFTFDLGLLYNVQMTTNYKTDATFDYEAIYKYAKNSDGSNTAVYDNGTYASVNDLLITKDQINKHSGHAADTMNWYRTHAGMNVGLNQSPDKTSGTTNYSTGSLGFMFRPEYSFYLSNHVAINLVAYYMYQMMNNEVKPGYQLTNKVGEYHSSTNSVASSINQSYGVNLGLRFFLGKFKQKPEAPSITEDAKDPTCGLCDGAITFHNLTPGQSVTINYVLNGSLQPSRTDSVSQFGTVKISNLCAGEYSKIEISNGTDTKNAPPITLVNPSIGYYSESYTNPLSFGACNGSIKVHGLKPGLTVTIKYTLNGTIQPPFTGTIEKDGTATITGLCAGNYTGIFVSVNSCSINGADITLTNPAQVQPQVIQPQYYDPEPRPRRNTHAVAERQDVSAPILFDVGKSIIKSESTPVLEEAIYELNDDENTYISIDGYTDIDGSPEFNQVLSKNRAEAVKYYLVHHGIAAKRLDTEGHGIKDPVSDNSTAEGKSKNRRCVMSLKHGKR